MKLTQIMNEGEEKRPLSNEVKKHFLEIVSTYNKYQESLDRKSDIQEIAETLGGITEAARTLAIHEGGDWFDKHTIKRNMSELEKLGKEFDKCAVEAKSLDQRLGGLYEDMGNILSRYYKMGDITEEQMKERLGMNESKSSCGCGCGGVTEGGCSTSVNEAKTYKKGDKLKIKLRNGKKIDVVFDTYSKQKGVAFGKIKDGSGEYDVKPFNLDTIVESVVTEGKLHESLITEKQLKGLEGIDNKTPLTKISDTQKLKIIQSTGNIISFKVPKGFNRNFWQVISKGKIKKGKSLSGDVVYTLPGRIINSPQFKSEKDLINGVDWESVEQTRRFNESVNENARIVLVDPNKNKFVKTVMFSGPNRDADKEVEKLNKKLTSSQKQKEFYWKVSSFESVNEEKPGLWANIRAKKARGEKPAHKNSQAHKDAVKAGKKINKEESVVSEAKFGYKDSTSSYINNHKDEYKVAEKLNKGNEVKFYDSLSQMEEKIGHPKFMIFLSNALRGYKVDMYKDPKIKNPQDAQEALYLLSK